VDKTTLLEAEKQLSEQGLNLQVVVQTLLERIAKEGGIPFTPIHKPSTISAEDILRDVYGETPTPDAQFTPGVLEDSEESKLLPS
jgi:antitoxin component of RelBE/YafQ-DinJ toxin-antitoxin module